MVPSVPLERLATAIERARSSQRGVHAYRRNNSQTLIFAGFLYTDENVSSMKL